MSDETYKNYPICVLAGSYQEYLDYVVSQGADAYDRRWFHGTDTMCGRHFSRIVTVGTFFKIKNAQAILSYCKAYVWPPSQEVPEAPMKQGEIRKLPKGSSPLWTDQWAYQGTAKSPYIISGKRKPGDGQNTGWSVNWQCSCKSWTTFMPRTDCKHIIAIKLKEKIMLDNVMAAQHLNPVLKKDFENFLAQKQAGVVISSGLKKSGLQDKGRKFRV